MQAPSSSVRRGPAALPRPWGGRRIASPLRMLRLPVAAALLVAVLALGWLALRDSRLVAVTHVEVTGVSGPQRQAIRSALETAGRDLTALHVRPEVLEAAVAPYAVVKAVRAEADLPHGLRVRVTQRDAVAALVTARGRVPVAADGTVLAGTSATALPEVRLSLPPAGRRIADARTLAVVDVVAVAPAPLRAKIATAFRGSRGLTVQLAGGPSVAFGTPRRLRAKWAALTAVLGSRSAAGAAAIDVRVPEHPAAAGLEQESTQRGQPSTLG